MIVAAERDSVLEVYSEAWFVLDSEECYATLVNMKNGETLDVIFLSSDKMYIEEEDCVVPWSDKNDKIIHFPEKLSTGEAVDGIISEVMTRLFSRYREDYNNLDYMTQVNISQVLVKIKKTLIEKITDWLLKNPGCVMTAQDMESIVGDVKIQLNRE